MNSNIDKLVSDSVEIGDMVFKKAFYITNSSDKSRKLSPSLFYLTFFDNVVKNKNRRVLCGF